VVTHHVPHSRATPLFLETTCSCRGIRRDGIPHADKPKPSRNGLRRDPNGGTIFRDFAPLAHRIGHFRGALERQHLHMGKSKGTAETTDGSVKKAKSA
jgi:hypothetical protein